jgi:hypothetical protein
MGDDACRPAFYGFTRSTDGFSILHLWDFANIAVAILLARGFDLLRDYFILLVGLGSFGRGYIFILPFYLIIEVPSFLSSSLIIHPRHRLLIRSE